MRHDDRYSEYLAGQPSYSRTGVLDLAESAWRAHQAAFFTQAPKTAQHATLEAPRFLKFSIKRFGPGLGLVQITGCRAGVFVDVV